jgi:hypothetical protein
MPKLLAERLKLDRTSSCSSAPICPRMAVTNLRGRAGASLLEAGVAQTSLYIFPYMNTETARISSCAYRP